MIRFKLYCLFIVCCSIALAQKTRNKNIEITEVYPPEFLLPASFSTIDTVLINSTGYGFADFEESTLFDLLTKEEHGADLTLSIFMETPTIQKVEITADLTEATDGLLYQVLLTYIPNFGYSLNYNLHDFQLLSVNRFEQIQREFRVRREDIREENNKYYLRSEEALYAWINARSIEEALSEAAGTAKWLTPRQETNYVGIYSVSDKKQDYSQVAEANAWLQEGYDAYLSDNQEMASQKLLQGAEALKVLLSDADYQNKKAFINAKVAGALAGSIGYAYEYAGKYEEALEMVALIDKNKLKIPGGLYYNPEFTYDWKERLLAKKNLTGFERPVIQPIEVKHGLGEVDGEIIINYLDVTPYTAYTVSLFEFFTKSYLPKDKLGQTPEQLLFGPNSAEIINQHYGISNYDGLELYTIDFNGNATSIIEFGIRSNQFTGGTVRKVTRLISADRSKAIDVSVPHGIFNDEHGYRRFVSEINLLPTLSTKELNLNLVVRKEEENAESEWMGEVSEAFPIMDQYRTVRKVNYKLREMTLEKGNDQDLAPKTRITYNWYLVELMRRRNNKLQLIDEFKALPIDNQIKNKAVRLVEKLADQHHRRTYNHDVWH